MARMNGKSRFPIDAALILRDQAQAALAATTDLAVQKLAQVGAVWQNPADPRDGEVTVVAKIEAATLTNPCSVDIYVADDEAKTNPVKAASYPIAAAGAVLEIPVDQFGLLNEFPTKKNWFVKVTVGASSSVAAFVYLAPDAP